MPMKRYKPEQIVTLLRQIEVEIANGKTTPQACKEAEITVQTYYRWRKEFGSLKLDQAKRLKELERENAKLNSTIKLPESVDLTFFEHRTTLGSIS
jgi:putative transposase